MNVHKTLSALLLLTLMGVLVHCSHQKKEEVRGSEVFDSPFLNLDESVKYVGAEACQPCHANMFESFMHTGMGQSFGKATQSKSKGFAKSPGYVYDSLMDLHYLSFWEDKGFKIKEFRLLEGDTIHKRTEKIDYIIGSGHHTNSHLLFRNGFLFQAPITFYTQDQIWDLPPGFEQNNSRFSRRIEAECITCHNALPNQDIFSENKYLNIPEGISCERCHGPGELHVAKMLSGKFSDKAGQFDSTIVNPKRLPWNLQVDVCQRCHLQGNIVLKPDKSFHDFKPGMPLHSVFSVFMPAYAEGAEFKMAAHAERFQMSKCFTETNKDKAESYNADLDFTCISCHNPHVSVKETKTEIFNARCLSCHTTPKIECSEKPELILEKEKNCVSCHMPVSGSQDIPHVTVHDHYIRKDYSNKESKKGSLIGLKSINTTNPDLFSTFSAYVSYFEKFEKNPYYLQKAKEMYAQLGNSQHALSLKIYFHYTSNEFSTIVTLAKQINKDSITDAWTFYRIAKGFENSNNKSKALEWMKIATELKKHYPPFLNAQITLEIDLKKYAFAQLHLDELLKLDPKDEIAHSQQARLYYVQGDMRKANITALKSLLLNPDDIIAMEILVSIADLSGNKPPLYEYWKSRVVVR